MLRITGRHRIGFECSQDQAGIKTPLGHSGERQAATAACQQFHIEKTQWSPFFFCSQDCCLCTKHQSVKELRHARSKGRQQTQRKPNKSNQKPQTNKPQKQKTAAKQVPFAAGETGETGETETAPSKQTIGPILLRGKQTFLTSENGKTLTSRILLRMKGRFRKTTRQTKPQNNTNNQNTPKKPNQKTTTKQTKTTEPALHPGET